MVLLAKQVKSVVRVGGKFSLTLLRYASFTLTLVSAMRCTASVAEPKCTDISSIDFKNSDIVLEDDIPLHFKNGKFTEFGDVFFDNGKETVLEGAPHTPEWEDNFTDDFILRPIQDVTIRVLVITRDHVGGTGTGTYSVAYVCDRGRLKRVHKESHDGGGFQKISESQVSITYGVWKEKDPHCCPSMTRKDTYTWSLEKGIFVLESSTEGYATEEGWVKCHRKDDCTSVIVGCSYWKPVNKKYTEELKNKYLAVCKKSIDPGPQPKMECHNNLCRRIK
jgi:hypothetical protein